MGMVMIMMMVMRMIMIMTVKMKEMIIVIIRDICVSDDSVVCAEIGIQIWREKTHPKNDFLRHIKILIILYLHIAVIVWRVFVADRSSSSALSRSLQPANDEYENFGRIGDVE